MQVNFHFQLDWFWLALRVFLELSLLNGIITQAKASDNILLERKHCMTLFGETENTKQIPETTLSMSTSVNLREDPCSCVTQKQPT